LSDAQNTLERRRRVHLSPRLCTVVNYLTDLSVELGGAVFKNPVMPASGTYDYFENNADCFPVSELGAVMIKSVHRLRRPGNPGPRIAEVCGGMLNCVGIPSVGIEAFLRDELPRYENIGTQVILSISGSEPVHYAEIAELVGDDPRIAALEMNLSCPNVGSGLPFSSDPQLLYDTVRQTRQRTTLPLYAKLSPNVTDIRVSCRAAEDAGADALTLSNTFRAMTIDIQKRRPYLGNLSGGMSGPAVKPMNMFLVWQAYETVHIPIIACGGIASWRDAVEYLMAGASAVQVGSCNFNDPMTMHNIIHDLDSYLHRNGIASVRELCGAAHKQ
jgi:dihydroorotate dehydrogenase (NAD+) catalytic subunit